MASSYLNWKYTLDASAAPQCQARHAPHDISSVLPLAAPGDIEGPHWFQEVNFITVTLFAPLHLP